MWHSVQRSFSALKHPGFRIFWFGQMISLIGSWMQSVGQPWLAYTITQSPLKLGLVGAVQFAPTLFLSLFVGAWVDRVSKRKTIIFTQVSLALFSFLYFVLIYSGEIRYWHILVIAGLQGIINAIDMPARHSFMIELVGKKDLMNAIALNSTIFNSARMIGPALAGVVIAQFNISFCFFANGISYLPLITGLFFIRPEQAFYRENLKPLLGEVIDGLRYIASEKLLLKTVVILAIVCTFIMNFNVLIPVYAKTVLQSNASGFAYLMSAMGGGSLIGALVMASISERGPRFGQMVSAALLLAFLLLIMGIFHFNYLSYLLIAIAGVLSVTFLTNANSTMQVHAADQYRSRVISLYFLVNAGSIPLGNLLVGGVSGAYGVRSCLVLIGSSVLLFVSLTLLYFKLNRQSSKLSIQKVSETP